MQRRCNNIPELFHVVLRTMEYIHQVPYGTLSTQLRRIYFTKKYFFNTTFKNRSIMMTLLSWCNFFYLKEDYKICGFLFSLWCILQWQLFQVSENNQNFFVCCFPSNPGCVVFHVTISAYFGQCLPWYSTTWSPTCRPSSHNILLWFIDSFFFSPQLIVIVWLEAKFERQLTSPFIQSFPPTMS